MSEEIELSQKPIVIWIPEDAIELQINAKILKNNKVIDVTHTFPFCEIHDMFKDAEADYIPEDAVFVLTEQGRQRLEQIKMSEQMQEHIDEILREVNEFNAELDSL